MPTTSAMCCINCCKVTGYIPLGEITVELIKSVCLGLLLGKEIHTRALPASHFQTSRGKPSSHQVPGARERAHSSIHGMKMWGYTRGKWLPQALSPQKCDLALKHLIQHPSSGTRCMYGFSPSFQWTLHCKNLCFSCLCAGDSQGWRN